MKPWREALIDGAFVGTVGSVVSSVAIAALSRRQTGHALAGVNATSHWLWSRRAYRQNGFSLRYTVSGYAIHHLASIFWGVLCEKYLAGPAPRAPQALRVAALTTSAAVIGDYLVVPRRMTPGIEHRLSPGAIALFYVAFGVGLAAGVRARAWGP